MWKAYGGLKGTAAPCDGNKPCNGPRMYWRNVIAPQHPKDFVEGALPQELERWSMIKYILHLDGVTCSTRLTHYLGLGFTTFVEQSGYNQHFASWMRPMEHFVPVWKDGPEDLMEQLQWARDHDEEARMIGVRAREFAMRHLTQEARGEYWRALLKEYGRLMTYKPEKRPNAVPLREFIPFRNAQYLDKHGPGHQDAYNDLPFYAEPEKRPGPYGR